MQNVEVVLLPIWIRDGDSIRHSLWHYIKAIPNHGVCYFICFSLAVLMLVTNIEINWLFSSIKGSSCDAGFTRFAFAVISNHTLVSRSSLRHTCIL